MGVTLGGSTSCVPRSRNCISCVPRCPLHVYQLRPEFLTSNMTSCVPRLVRNCISCIERFGYTNVQQLEGSYTVLKCVTLYTITWTYTELLNDIDNTVVISCYCLMFKTYLKKKSLFGEGDTHIMFLKSSISS